MKTVKRLNDWKSEKEKLRRQYLANMNQNNIYQKLHTIQSKINHLTKTEENKYQHYKYVSEYQLLTLLKPLLTETKLILLLSDVQASFSKEKTEKE
jgi:hypothetical protein